MNVGEIPVNLTVRRLRVGYEVGLSLRGDIVSQKEMSFQEAQAILNSIKRVHGGLKVRAIPNVPALAVEGQETDGIDYATAHRRVRANPKPPKPVKVEEPEPEEKQFPWS